jgi:hypothetical protein
MKIQIKFWHKIVLALAAFAVAIAGFMLKLPSGFSHSDKELHSLFYFLAAGFLNVLFAKKNLVIHAFIFALLYTLGWAIEYAQQYSNKFFSHRIHGNADPEDIHMPTYLASSLSPPYGFVLWGLLLYGKISLKKRVRKVLMKQKKNHKLLRLQL